MTKLLSVLIVCNIAASVTAMDVKTLLKCSNNTNNVETPYAVDGGCSFFVFQDKKTNNPLLAAGSLSKIKYGDLDTGKLNKDDGISLNSTDKKNITSESAEFQKSLFEYKGMLFVGLQSLIKVVNITEKKVIKKINAHKYGITAVVAYEDSSDNTITKIVSCARDGTIKIWGLDGTLLKTMQRKRPTKKKVLSIKERENLGSNEDFRDFVEEQLQNPDKSISKSEYQDYKEMLDQSDPIMSIFTYKDKIISGSFHEINIWDAKTGNLIKTLEGHEGAVLGVHVFEDPSDQTAKIVSGGQDGTIKIWDFTSGKLLKTLSRNQGGGISGVFVYKNKVVASSWNGTIEIWDIASGKNIAVLSDDKKNNEGRPMEKVIVHNGTIVAGMRNGSVKIWPAQKLLDQ